MHRLAAAALALVGSTPLALPAQQFQFMQERPQTSTSLLPLAVTYFGFVAVDDFDGDGHPDVAANCAGASLGVFPGSASGFTPPASLLPWGGQRLLPIDLDGDGDRDLALVPPQLPDARALVLYENTSSGLQPIALPPVMVGVPVQGAALGDVDADGFVDLVLAVTAGTPVQSIVLARGGPGLQFTFDLAATPVGLPPGLWPALLDADGDGDLDVLATNATSGMRLLRNTGGTFADATATLPPGLNGHTFLLPADLDGDGRTDCAAVVNSGDVDVLWGTASGLTLAPAVVTFSDARSLWPADFDGDGDIDLLVHTTPSGLDVMWNQGLRRFTRSSLVPPGVSLRGAGDVDSDGADDVVFANDWTFVRCKHHARFEDAAFSLGIPPIPAPPLARGAPLAGDANGDGRTDLVTPGSIGVFVDHALGGGVWRQSVSATPLPGSLVGARAALADFDGDGDQDVVVKTDSTLTVAANTGSGTFLPSQLGTSMPAFAARDDLRVADVDSDGDADLVVADTSGVALIRNLGAGQFAGRVVLVPPAPLQPLCVELADVDGDGDLDLISKPATPGGPRILANDGRGFFAPNAALSVDLGTTPTSVRAGDLDGDGDQDLAVVDSILRVYRNDGSGAFTESTLQDLPATQIQIFSNVVVADLDDDGDLDLAALRLSSHPWLLLVNDGSGSFTDRSSSRVEPLLVPNQIGLLRAEDADDDGDADLLAYVSNRRWILMNHVRQCRSGAVPRLGGVAAFELMSGPGFGQAGLAALGFAPALAATPLPVPGMLGKLHLDPASLQILSIVPTSAIGVSSVFVPVPPHPLLFGAELWFQGAVLAPSGPPGFTNAVYEVVLR